MVSPEESACDGFAEKPLAEFELSGFEDEISTATLFTQKPALMAEPAKSVEQCPISPQASYLVFLPVLAGAIMYGALISPTFCFFMGAISLLMVLPGVYLWVIDGSRPEDYVEKRSEQSMGNLAAFRFLLLGLGAVVGMQASTSFQIIMGSVAALMLLPGIYLWLVEGCRPEDYEDKCHSRDEDSFCDIMLARMGLGIMFGMWYSKSFRIFQGIVSALMLLPGLYLWMVEGCRPEDYDENCCNEKAGRFAVLKMPLLAVGSMLIMPTFVSILLFGGIIMTALMLLPGMYLWAVDGCRPENYEDDSQTDDKDGCIDIMFARLVLGNMIGMWVSKSFRIFQGIVAMLVLLPGVYLWVADGCRPEDYEENCHQNKVEDRTMLKFALLGLGTLLSAWVSTSVLIFVTVMAALTLLPGIYLWVFDGARPEDYMQMKQA